MVRQTLFKNNRLPQIIVVLSIIALLSSFTLTVTIFAYGAGRTTYLYVLLYPTLLISIILMLLKSKLGFILNFLLSICYSFLLTSQVGEFLFYKDGYPVLLLVLVLPYVVYLALMTLNLLYLTSNKKHANVVLKGFFLLPFLFFMYSVIERYNKDYPNSIFAEIEFNKDGTMIITCKPGFADNRSFIVQSSSRELALAFKRYGEFHKGDCYVSDLSITKNFNFRNFKSFKIKQVNGKKLKSELIWKVADIKGDVSFLLP